MGARYSSLCTTVPNSVAAPARCVVLAACLVALCAPAWCLNKAAVVRELEFPRITLNLNVTFSTTDLRIPPSKDPEADIKRLMTAIETNPDPQLQLQLARLLLFTQQLQAAAMRYRIAIDGFDKQIAADPSNALAHQNMAEALVAVGEDEDAADYIEQAMILDENLWRANELAADLHAKHAVLAHNQGLYHLMTSHLAAAEFEAKEANRLAPKEPEPLVMLFLAKWLPAVIQLRQDANSGLGELGKFEELGQLLKKAADLAPDYPRLRLFSITCRLTPFFTVQMNQGLDKAIWAALDESQQRLLRACRDELVALGDSQPDLRGPCLLFGGVASFMMDESKRMYELYDLAAASDEKSTASLEAMVGFLAYERKWPQALKAAQRIIERKPSGKAYNWVGRIHAEQRAWKLAEENFRLAMTYEGSQGIANLGLGLVLLKSGCDPVQALVPLKTAWETIPDRVEVLLAWGVELALVGEVKEGTRYVRQALDYLPDSPGKQVIAKEFGITTP